MVTCALSELAFFMITIEIFIKGCGIENSTFHLKMHFDFSF